MITRYYPYALSLEAPLLLASLDADPNSACSLDFIPGGAVRGVAARTLCQGGLDRSDPSRFRHLILGGRVAYLNAYLAVEGRRTVPTPASLRREKYGTATHDLAATTPSSPLERLKTPFLTLGTPELVGASAATTGRAHHQRDRSAGRPMLDRGSVFHFEALDAGQEFHGFIAIHGDDEAAIAADFQMVREALGPMLLLGRSRRAGYGGAATLRWSEPVARELEGDGVLSGYVPADGTFRLLLTSDYLGRDRTTGQPDPSALTNDVTTLVGGKAEVVQSFLTFRTVGGFNRKWGLELPQMLAVQAGSVLLLRAREHLSGSDLAALEAAALGERRVEGFGRFVFLDPPREGVTIRSATTTIPEPTGEPPPLVLMMQARLLDEAVHRRIQETAARIAASAERLPSRSLLARLRSPLRLPAPEALQQLRTWLGDGKGALRPLAVRQLEACHLGDHGRPWSLYDWLREYSRRSDLSRPLGYDAVARYNHLLDEGAVRGLLTSAEREVPARVAFLDAVLAALARRSVRKEAADVR